MFMYYVLWNQFIISHPPCNSDARISPQDPRFHYEGRWIINGTTSYGNAAFADWPCRYGNMGCGVFKRGVQN